MERILLGIQLWSWTGTDVGPVMELIWIWNEFSM